jgi:RNA polymerase sigma-70 factor (ECF subfamily)
MMTNDPAPDSELVAGVVRGDLDSFSALVHRYRDAYTRYAVRMLGERGDAEDVLQGAWMRAWRNIANCREPKRFGAWMYQIVVNECRTHLARRTQRDHRFANSAELERLAARPDGDALLRDEIERALESLPNDQREAFVLKHVEQMEYEEMAELTGCGVSALKMRVKRATARLRDLLEEVQYG